MDQLSEELAVSLSKAMLPEGMPLNCTQKSIVKAFVLGIQV
jgi:hypothetical protein